MPMTNTALSPITEKKRVTRIRVFVDFWNFQLSMNEHESRATAKPGLRVKIDWKGMGQLFAAEAAKIAKFSDYSFEGCKIYASHDPKSPDKKFFNWMMTFLNRQPGVHIECLERKPKALPRCQKCHREIVVCPFADCGVKLSAMIEKGVDTMIVTDMIRFAWEGAYDVAVLASSDRDFIPAVKFLEQKGLKVIQAGFPPQGVDLATACWASFNAFSLKDKLIRPEKE